MERVLLNRRGVATLAGLFVGLCALLAAGVAEACPPGTVFSAYQGRGICAFAGQGAKAAVLCFKTRDKKCPANFKFQHKASDAANDYCCPTAIPVVSDAQCRAQCEPLLKADLPVFERNRVYNNCFVLCRDPDGIVICPDGRRVKAGTPCN